MLSWGQGTQPKRLGGSCAWAILRLAEAVQETDDEEWVYEEDGEEEAVDDDPEERSHSQLRGARRRIETAKRQKCRVGSVDVLQCLTAIWLNVLAAHFNVGQWIPRQCWLAS